MNTTKSSGATLTDWRPEDEAFWAASGATLARRNLAFSILSEHAEMSHEIDLEKARAELERAKSAGEYDSEAEAEEAVRRAEARIRAVERAS